MHTFRTSCSCAKQRCRWWDDPIFCTASGIHRCPVPTRVIVPSGDSARLPVGSLMWICGLLLDRCDGGNTTPTGAPQESSDWTGALVDLGIFRESFDLEAWLSLHSCAAGVITPSVSCLAN
ncbi:uncharacterized protein LOC144587889 isoform X1 [Pogona vitticeps]